MLALLLMALSRAQPASLAAAPPPTDRANIFVSVGADRPPNATGIVGELVGIPSGTWWMGSLAGEAGHQDDEGPLLATVARQQLMKEEMTRSVWVNKLHLAPTWGVEACRDDSGVVIQGVGADSCPVTEVSWCQAVVAANTASALDGLSKAYSYAATDEVMFKADFEACDTLSARVTVDVNSRGYRLPTEAEWDWGARGQEGYAYAGSDDVAAVGWISPGAEGVHPTCSATKRANGWGVCDMTGNVWEWVQDVYASPLGTGAAPQGAGDRVYRGGGWYEPPVNARVAKRRFRGPGGRRHDLGFRLTRAVP